MCGGIIAWRKSNFNPLQSTPIDSNPAWMVPILYLDCQPVADGWQSLHCYLYLCNEFNCFTRLLTSIQLIQLMRRVIGYWIIQWHLASLFAYRHAAFICMWMACRKTLRNSAMESETGNVFAWPEMAYQNSNGVASTRRIVSFISSTFNQHQQIKLFKNNFFYSRKK